MNGILVFFLIGMYGMHEKWFFNGDNIFLNYTLKY